jgi:hypothetical protein
MKFQQIGHVIDDLTKDLNDKYDAKHNIDAIDEQIAVMEAKENETLTKQKIDTFENTISILKKCLTEKDEYIVIWKQD